MEKKWLCQVWGQGEHNCKWEKSPNIFLEPTWMNLKAIQMGSNPNAKLNHHMKSYDLAPCEVTRLSDKVKLHDVSGNCIWAVTSPNLVTSGFLVRQGKATSS